MTEEARIAEEEERQEQERQENLHISSSIKMGASYDELIAAATEHELKASKVPDIELANRVFHLVQATNCRARAEAMKNKDGAFFDWETIDEIRETFKFARDFATKVQGEREVVQTLAKRIVAAVSWLENGDLKAGLHVLSGASDNIIDPDQDEVDRLLAFFIEIK